jgi:amino acid adenylation domain-containing protein
MNNIEQTYPLSPMQQGMLFHSLYAPESGVDIEQMIINLHERLNVSAFERAWRRVIERHPVLRTRFRWEGLDEPLQDVHHRINLSLEQHDWRDFSDREQASQLEAYLQFDRQRAFRLTEAPLMRLVVFRVGEAGYQCVWTFHHILLDGRSFPIVLREVFAFYDAFCQDQNLQLKRPRPYRDYIEWLQQQDWSGVEKFWRQGLGGFEVPTPFMVDRARGGVSAQEKSRGKQEIRLSEAATSALVSLVHQHQLTLNTIVQGAWALLLSRYSGETEVVFGATRACRRSTVDEAQAMVGLFINTLPVRVRVPPEMPLLTWLKELRAQQIAVRTYEHTPLVKIQNWSDIPGGMPLFESILVFENYALDSVLRAQGGNWRNREFRLLEQTNYPLAVGGYSDTELLLKIAYDRGRFEDATVTRMLGHIQTLLEGIVADPDQRLSDLPLLTRSEHRQLLEEWNATGANYPRGLCVHQLFEAQVERTPEATAVVFQDEQITYQVLNRRANRLANRLQALGVGPEVLVAICVEPGLEMVVGLLAILKAGGAYVPLDPAYPKERLRYMLKDSGAGLILTQKKLAEFVKSLGDSQFILLDNPYDSLENTTGDNDRIVYMSGVRPDSLAYVIYTSGSTGLPKGAMIEHKNLVNYLCWVNKALLGGDVHDLPLITKLTFDASLKQLFAPLLRGSRVWILPDDIVAQPTKLLQVLALATKVGLNCVPSLWEAILDTLHHHQTLIPADSLTHLYVGGEPLSKGLVKRSFATFANLQIWNLYGPTETTANSSAARIVPTDKVTIGRPIANTQLYILDPHLQPAPVGVPGELYIGGEGLARGYLNRPELTAERFIRNPFSEKSGGRLYKTGDLARYHPDGNIEFLGRLDHQVKIRGFRIELGEVEVVLSQHPAVRGSIAVVREDAPGHKRLVAYIVPNEEKTPTVNDLRIFLKQRLPEYMIPAAFVILDALPLTPNGKVDRRVLPEPVQARPELESMFVAPQTEDEKTVAEIWAEVLGLERVGVYDNFFELGGHSLLAMQVIYRLEGSFQMEFPLRNLFEIPTVAGLAKHIETIRQTVQNLQDSSLTLAGEREEIEL